MTPWKVSPDPVVCGNPSLQAESELGRLDLLPLQTLGFKATLCASIVLLLPIYLGFVLIGASLHSRENELSLRCSGVIVLLVPVITAISSAWAHHWHYSTFSPRMFAVSWLSRVFMVAFAVALPVPVYGHLGLVWIVVALTAGGDIFTKTYLCIEPAFDATWAAIHPVAAILPFIIFSLACAFYLIVDRFVPSPFWGMTGVAITASFELITKFLLRRLLLRNFWTPTTLRKISSLEHLRTCTRSFSIHLAVDAQFVPASSLMMNLADVAYNPASLTWVVSLITFLIQSVLVRTLWQSWLCSKLFCKHFRFGQDDLARLKSRSAACYFRFLLPSAVLLARLVLQKSALSSDKAALVLIASFAETVLQDILVWAVIKMDLLPRSQMPLQEARPKLQERYQPAGPAQEVGMTHEAEAMLFLLEENVKASLCSEREKMCLTDTMTCISSLNVFVILLLVCLGGGMDYAVGGCSDDDDVLQKGILWWKVGASCLDRA